MLWYKIIHSQHKNPTILFIGILIITIIFSYGTTIMHAIEYLHEDIVYAHNPKAEVAYGLGNKHFDSANHAGEYDIDRAEYFFRLAVLQDPHIPSIYHQLARIEFLRGNFAAAMGFINIQIDNQGENIPNSYYVRGLIEGYMGAYKESALSYETYLKYNPHNWAAINDYAWVLLKANRPNDAAVATAGGLVLFPHNPWLLNTNATALYENGDISHARIQIMKAHEAVQSITKSEWLTSYPGNDPQVADQGIATFKQSIEDNIHSMYASSTPARQK